MLLSKQLPGSIRWTSSMRKGLIIGLIIGLALPPCWAAMNVGITIENVVLQDIFAASTLSALIIKYGKTPGQELDAYKISAKMLEIRNSNKK